MVEVTAEQRDHDIDHLISIEVVVQAVQIALDRFYVHWQCRGAAVAGVVIPIVQLYGVIARAKAVA